MRKHMFVLFILFLSMSLFSETIHLSLKKSIELALKNNPEILQEKAKLKQAEESTNMAYSSIFPKIDLSGYRVLKEKVMTIEMPPLFPGMPSREVQMDFTKNYQLTLQFTEPLFMGGKIFFGIKSAEAAKSAQKALLAAKKSEVKAKVKSVYFSIILLEYTKNSIKEAVKTAEDIRDTIKVKLNEGLSKKLDLLMAENKLRELKASLLKIESKIYEAKNSLKNLLGITEEANIIITGKITEVKFPLKYNELKEILFSNNKILKAIKENKRAIGFRLKSGYSEFLPKFILGGQYNFRGDSLSNFKNWDNYYSVNLSVSMNLFSGFRRSSNIGILKAQKEEIEIKILAYKRELLSQLKNSIKHTDYLLKKIDVSKQNLENSKIQLNIAKESYKQGLISYIQLEAAENSYLSSKNMYLQSIYEYYVSIFKIESLLCYEIFKF